jgi:hypothetical protein
MAATMNGCEIVCPPPIGSASSAYAEACAPTGTNSWRGTVAIASSTRAEMIPRERICRATISLRAATKSGLAPEEDMPAAVISAKSC